MACAQAVKEREAAIKNANEKERQAKALKGSLDGEIKVRVLVMSPCLGCGTWPQQRGAKVETVLKPPPPWRWKVSCSSLTFGCLCRPPRCLRSPSLRPSQLRRRCARRSWTCRRCCRLCRQTETRPFGEIFITLLLSKFGSRGRGGGL